MSSNLYCAMKTHRKLCLYQELCDLLVRKSTEGDRNDVTKSETAIRIFLTHGHGLNC